MDYIMSTAAHASARHMRMLFLFLRRLGHTSLGGDEQAGYRGRILQRRAHDFGPGR